MNSVHPRFDLNLLRVFEVVYRERQIARAADVLSLTPSAVSHAVRRLRDYFEDQLFRREGNEMLPTPVCERLAPALLEQLASLRQTLQLWSKFDPASTRQSFRLGMPEAIEISLLPRVMRAFERLAPHASLACVAFDRGDVSRLLASGQLDVVVDVARPVRSPLMQAPLHEDAFCVASGPKIKWRRAPTLKQYLASRHVVVSGRSEGTVLEDGTLLAQGLERQVVLRCQTYPSALRIVGATDCLLTAPTSLIDELASGLQVRRWSLPVNLAPVRLSLYWHANNEGDAASLWLRQVVSDAVRQKPTT